MKKMTDIIIVSCWMLSVNIAVAQPIKLVNDSTVGYLNKIGIDSDQGNFSSFPDKNIKTYFSHKNFNGSICRDGTVFISNQKIIKQNGDRYEEITIPHADRFDFRSPLIDETGQYVSYTIQSGTEASVIFFDTNKREIIAQYNHKRIDERRRMGHFAMSANGKIFAFSILEGGIDPSGHYIFLGEREKKDSAFETIREASQVAIVPGLTSRLFLSQSGERLTYQGKSGYFSNSPIQIYAVDKTREGWVKPREITFPDMEELSVLPKSKLFDIANNGRTILLSNGEKGLALIHENEGQWSKPEYLDYQTTYYDDAQISEDGITIALHAARTPIQEERTIDYDIYLFMKNDKQQWIKEKVNPDGVDPYGDILLTKDGKTLFWVPKNKE